MYVFLLSSAFFGPLVNQKFLGSIFCNANARKKRGPVLRFWSSENFDGIYMWLGWRKTRKIYRILTLRRLMSYIYMEHPFLMFLDHTQRRSIVGRTPLDE